MVNHNNKTTTIEIAMETYDNLYRIQQEIKKATGQKLSFDKIIKVVFAVNPVNELVNVLLGMSNV